VQVSFSQLEIDLFFCVELLKILKASQLIFTTQLKLGGEIGNV
jgi:hypothetical protein